MTVAVSNHKGGTGKTTTAVNLACALTKKRKSVLLVDLDPQGNLSYSLGIDEDANEISQVFAGEKDINEVIVAREETDVVPANMNLSDIELSLQGAEDREYYLKSILETVKKKYDFVIIDCPPSRSLLTVNALCVSDYVIIPVLPDVLSMQGIVHIIKTINEIRAVLNEKIKIAGILPVNVDRRKRISKEVLAFIKENIRLPIFKTQINTAVKITEAPSFGKSIFGYAPASASAKEYLQLAKELIALSN